MSIRLSPAYFHKIPEAERVRRLDPLNSILGGAKPVESYMVPGENLQRPDLAKVPPQGEMLGWISLDRELTIGMLDGSIICDLDDQPLTELCDQRSWIRFDNPELVRAFTSNQVLSHEGWINVQIKLTEREQPKLRRTVIWIDSEGDQHLGKLTDETTVEYQCYGGQDEILKSINEFPYWMDIPFNAINRDLHIGDDLEED